MAFDALVGDLVSVVNAEGQADQRKAHSHQQEEDHHHVKAAVQRLHKLRENWRDGGGHAIISSPVNCLLGCTFSDRKIRVSSTLPAGLASITDSLLDTCMKMFLIKPIIHA